MNCIKVIFRASPVVLLLLASCGEVPVFGGKKAAECDPLVDECLQVLDADDDTLRPSPRDGEDDASTTVSDDNDEGDAGVAAPTGTLTLLGSTVATLGDVSQPGFWLKTPLVDKVTAGRITGGPAGASADVTLIPKDGPKTGGSQISLPTLRLLGIALTDVTELVVYAR